MEQLMNIILGIELSIILPILTVVILKKIEEC